MSFWGCVVSPGKPKKSEASGELLHLSQACLEPNAPTGATAKLSLEENGTTYAIAWLTEGSHEFCALDLFVDSEEVTFHVTGKAAVHLTGYFEHDVDDDMEALPAKAGSAEAGKKTGNTEAKMKKPEDTKKAEKKGAPVPADDDDDEDEESEEEESEEEAPAPMKSGKDVSSKVSEKKTEKTKAIEKPKVIEKPKAKPEAKPADEDDMEEEEEESEEEEEEEVTKNVAKDKKKPAEDDEDDDDEEEEEEEDEDEDDEDDDDDDEQPRKKQKTGKGGDFKSGKSGGKKGGKKGKGKGDKGGKGGKGKGKGKKGDKKGKR